MDGKVKKWEKEEREEKEDIKRGEMLGNYGVIVLK